jgi:hypothetical protein
MTHERWEKISDAIFVVEIELDSATCLDGGEDENTKDKAERLLADATTLRKRLQRAFKPDGRCEGRYPVPQTSPPRDEPFDVTYRCALTNGHDGPHRLEE